MYSKLKDNKTYNKVIKNLKKIIKNCLWIYIGKVKGKYLYLVKNDKYYKEIKYKKDKWDIGKYYWYDFHSDKILLSVLFSSDKPLNKMTINRKDLLEVIKEDNCNKIQEYYELNNNQWELKYINDFSTRVLTFDKSTIWMRDIKREISQPMMSKWCYNNENCRKKYNKIVNYFHRLDSFFGRSEKLELFLKDDKKVKMEKIWEEFKKTNIKMILYSFLIRFNKNGYFLT